MEEQVHYDLDEVLLRPDGIVQINGSNHTYSASDIRKIHEKVATLSKGKKAALLVIGSEYTLIDVDARNYLASEEAGRYSKAVAYVIRSLAQRIILNFMIKTKKMPSPTRFFTDTEHAVKWLVQVKVKD
ncbi:MAG TPA: hypothetical protein PLQ93_04890 [Bacteroidia bacterium]|nr:hypothetical protein [Bacteroidia bacterium]